MPIRTPDLSSRPFSLTVERFVPLSPSKIYSAWTTGFGAWFADPGSVIMTAAVDSVFFFETVFKPETQTVASRHPHYGRFLALEKERLVQITWVTGGTEGAETVVTVKLAADGAGTHVSLEHAGFKNEASRDQHKMAWPFVLEQMEKRLQELEL